MATIRTFFVVPPKVHLLDMTGPAHIFHEAHAYEADLSLHFISINRDTQIPSSAGLFLGELQPFTDFSLTENDLLFLPGMDFPLLNSTAFLSNCGLFFSWLRAQANHGTAICSVCTGAFLLGYAGLLRKRKCTTHWKYFEEFETAFPEAILLKERLFVTDGNLHTSAGVSSGIDLALHLLEKYFGAPFAAKIAKEVVIYLRRSEKDPQLSIFLKYRNHINDRVHQIQDILSTRLHEGLTLEDLAEEVNTSARNLTRIFKKVTGLRVGEYQRLLRIERAKQLLQKGHTQEHVAGEVGLKSRSQLLKLLSD